MSRGEIGAKKFHHPGAGKGRGKFHGKGRQVDLISLEEVRNLLGQTTRQRDLLIEFLHLIQDYYGHLSSKHLTALAHEMRIPMAEVYEVATFYAHFDVVFDDQKPPPDITVRVCDSLTCEMMGAKALLKDLASHVQSDVRVMPAPCMGRCEQAPIVAVGHNHIGRATSSTVISQVKCGATQPIVPAYIPYDSYVESGGYDLLRSCLEGRRTADDIIDVLNDSGLKGLGGAGFPTGQKWNYVRQETAPRFMAVNADEGEPGTFKDRAYLEKDTHRFLEGMLLAAWSIEATDTYIYLRDEYPGLREVLTQEIARVKEAGFNFTKLHLRRGAGAYICGEESAMLESIEGKRGLPRHKPPFPSKVGLFGRPTLIHNVETLYWIRDLVEQGPKFFTSHGRHNSKGLRSFSVSGRVKDPGVKLAPAGISVRELIDEYCGGMAEGHTLKAYLPGGASGGLLPDSLADLPLDFGTLEDYGCFIGSAAIIVLSDKDDVKSAVINLLRFFEHESCGQCTPCRVGTEKAVHLMEHPELDKELLEELCIVMADSSICGLGQAAVNPIRRAIEHFPIEFS